MVLSLCPNLDSLGPRAQQLPPPTYICVAQAPARPTANLSNSSQNGRRQSRWGLKVSLWAQ